MRTMKEKRDYAREYYQEKAAKKRKVYEERHAEELALSRSLGAKVSYHKKQNNKTERRLQDKITELWRLTGDFIIPDEKIIKEVEKEIIKEELLYEDTIEEVDIEDCIVPDVEYDDNFKEMLAKQNSDYYEYNKEEVLDTMKNYYQKNRKDILEKKKEYYRNKKK